MSINVTKDGNGVTDDVTTLMDYNVTTSKPPPSRTYHPRLIQIFTYLREQCEQQFASQPRLTGEYRDFLIVISIIIII